VYYLERLWVETACSNGPGEDRQGNNCIKSDTSCNTLSPAYPLKIPPSHFSKLRKGPSLVLHFTHFAQGPS
jgi:hypothetical protein